MSYRHIIRRLTPVFHHTSCLVPAGAKSRICHNLYDVMGLNRTTCRTNILRCYSTVNTTADPPIINIQDEDDFMKRVIEASSTSPVIVDFHAHWCGPCKLLGPRLETVIAGEKGRITLAKVDIDENAELALRFNVQSVPTVYGIRNGSVIKSFIGLKEDDEIKSFVKELV